MTIPVTRSGPSQESLYMLQPVLTALVPLVPSVDLGKLITSVMEAFSKGMHSNMEKAMGGRKRRKSEDNLEKIQEDLLLI